jgi:ATP-dependent exoDNAse (exonuclease V) beta subunit
VNFNDQQRDAIEIRDHAIVAAGAGSGKTSVLVERYAALISDDGCSVESLLCLTFTRKAAGEMYERIYSRLSGIGDSPGAAAAIDNFDRARITTIDAFCSSLIRHHLGDYGISPQYRIADAAFYRELRDFSVNWLAAQSGHRVFQRLFEAFTASDVLDKLLIPLARDRFSHTRDLGADFEMIRGMLTEIAARPVRDFNDGFERLQAATDEMLANQKLKPEKRAAEEKTAIMLGELESDPLDFQWADDEAAERSIQRIGGILSALQTNRSMGAWKIPYKELVAPLKDQALPALMLLAEGGIYRDFYRLIAEFAEDVLEFKALQGVLFYRDLMDIAIDLLQTRPELADFLRREIKYIMIDEFQDNNELQKELLYLIAAREGYRGQSVPGFDELRPGVLFFVGDEKQSIYRFRGADVSVFKSLAADLELETGPLHLDQNFRSRPGLIRFFNGFFPRIMGGEASWEAEYRALQPGLAKASDYSPGEAAELLLVPGTGTDYDGERHLMPSESEAFLVAKRISELVSSGETIYDRLIGTQRPISHRDIAVVAKSTSNQQDLEIMFRRFGIPFVSDSTRTLFIDAPAHDVHSFLKSCIYPGDSLSIMAVLRGPAFRLADPALIRIVDMMSGDGAQPPEPDALGVFPEIAAEDLADYRRFLELRDRIRPMLDRNSHSRVLLEFWRESGYEKFMDSDALRRSFSRYYDYLLELFELHADRSMAELVEILEANLGSGERLDELELYHESRDAVNLMTVHKSKGLEFPVLFLTNANGRPFHGIDSSSPQVTLPDGTLVLYAGLGEELHRRCFGQGARIQAAAANPLVEAARQAENARENAELRRQLYVAFTRSEQRLFVTASGVDPSSDSREPSGTEPLTERKENFFDLIEAGLGFSRERMLELAPGQSAFASPADGVPAVKIIRCEHVEKRALGRSFKAAEPERSLGIIPALELPQATRRRFSVSDLLILTEDAPDRTAGYRSETGQRETDSEPGDAAEYGTLVHYLLQRGVQAMENGAGFALPADDAIPDAYLSHRGQALDLPGARRMALSLREMPLFASIAEAGRRHCEWAFELSLGPCLISGQVDLLLELSDGSALVIDYKTGADLEPGRYAVQLDAYRLAARTFGYQDVSAGIADLRRGIFTLLDCQYGEEELRALIGGAHQTK